MIVVAEVWAQHPKVVELREAGHRIYGYHEPCPAEPDLILHPAAHQWNDELWDYLPAALAAVRARKRTRRS